MENQISKENAQILLLNLFIELQEQCGKAGVHYYAVAGTLLGSVSHGNSSVGCEDADISKAAARVEKRRAECRGN